MHSWWLQSRHCTLTPALTDVACTQVAAEQRLNPGGDAEPHSPLYDDLLRRSGDYDTVFEELCHNVHVQAANGTVLHAMSDAHQTEADKAQMSPSAPMCKTQDVPSQGSGDRQPAASHGARCRLGTAAGTSAATRGDLHSPDQAQRPQHAKYMPLSVKSDHVACLDVLSSLVAPGAQFS